MRFTELKRLAIFNVVYETGSFSSAARRLSTSRSRISEQVSELENALGVRLIQRSTRALRFTEEGQKVYAESHKLKDIMLGVNRAVDQSIPRGRVVLSMNHDIAHRFIIPLMSKFHDYYPEVSLDLILDDEKTDLIGENVDLAIRIGFSPDAAYVARVMHEEPFRLYASPRLLALHEELHTIDDALRLPWINTTLSNPTGIHRLRFNGTIHDIQPARFVTCNSPMAAQTLAVNGIGLCPLLPSTVATYIKAKQLVPVLPEWQSDPLTFSLIYPSRKQLPLRTRVLVSFLLDANPFTAHFKTN